MVLVPLLLAIAQAEDPAAWFQRMERTLLESETLHVRSRMTGAGEEMSVDLTYGAPDRIAGTFDAGIKMEVRCDGRMVATSVYGNASRREAPDGFARRGLSNLARLGGLGVWMSGLVPGQAPAQPPEPEGMTWRGVEEVEVADGERRTAVGISYTLRWAAFGGPDTIEVRLWIDPETALPVRRELEAMGQTLVEVFEGIERNGPVDESAFEINEDWGRPPRVESHAWVPEARTVSLALDGRPASEALEEIARQTGWTIGPRPDGDERMVTLALENAPSLSALDEVCRQAGVTFEVPRARFGRWAEGWEYEPQGDFDITFQAAAPSTGPIAYVGPFSLRLVQVERSARIDYARTEPRRELRLSFRVACQPGATLLALSLQSCDATDDAGGRLRELPPPEESDETGVISFGFGGEEATWEPSIALSMPAREARRIVRLEGNLEAHVPRWHGEEEFTPSGERQEREVGGATLRLEGFDPEAADLSLAIAFRGLDMERFESPSFAASVEDGDGRAWQGGGSHTSFGGEEYTGTFEFQRGDAGPAARVVVRYQAGKARMVFPFVLEDIPLGEDR